MRKIPISNVRIALCGASGSGKTTLARALSGALKIEFKENSAGLLLTEFQKDYLVRTYGWSQSGHMDVIRLSAINPAFGYDFQTELLKTRSRWINEHAGYIIDRSPVDNLTYFMLQVAPFINEAECAAFVKYAQGAIRPITHVIYIPTLNSDVEVNHSRVANWYYQQMVTALFEANIHTYFNPNAGDCKYQYHKVATWDWETRFSDVLKFILDTVSLD